MPLASRDVEPGNDPRPAEVREGRSLIAVIGIDNYDRWPRLANAVSDATGILDLFKQLAFVEAVPPLLEEAATGDAIRSLVTDRLRYLSKDDSLVLFFAGHGHTQVLELGSTSVKTGYIIPADADEPGGQVASWVRLDSWLSDVARLPPRHILVIIDACHSGVALGALVKWRDAVPRSGPLDELQARLSRRIITSALDDQRAMDGGPFPQHSLFTGCLLEGLTGGLAEGGRTVATGSEIGLYIQHRVRTYPQSTQTPDFGALELDQRGEIIVPLLLPKPLPAVATTTETKRSLATSPTTKARHRASARAMLGGVALVGVAMIGILVVFANPPRPSQGGAHDAGVVMVLDAPRQDAAVAPVPDAPSDPFIAAGHLGVRFQAHQVTRGEYARYLATLDVTATNSAIPRFEWDDTLSDAPVAWVTFGQASRYCASMGARLPTEAEWNDASNGSWGIDLGDRGTKGPLREWTSSITQSTLVSIRGGTPAATPEQLASSHYLRVATPAEELQHRNTAEMRRDAVSGKDVGIRCVK